MKITMIFPILIMMYLLQGCSAQQVTNAAIGTAKLPVKAAGAIGRTAGSVAGGAIGGAVGGNIGRKVGSAVGSAAGGAAVTKGL